MSDQRAHVPLRPPRAARAARRRPGRPGAAARGRRRCCDHRARPLPDRSAGAVRCGAGVRGRSRARVRAGRAQDGRRVGPGHRRVRPAAVASPALGSCPRRPFRASSRGAPRAAASASGRQPGPSAVACAGLRARARATASRTIGMLSERTGRRLTAVLAVPGRRVLAARPRRAGTTAGPLGARAVGRRGDGNPAHPMARADRARRRATSSRGGSTPSAIRRCRCAVRR